MSNENNIKIKDPEGREYDDSGSATLKKVISVICVIFSLVGIITNSIYPLTGMKKGGIFLGFTLCLIFLLYPTKIKGRRLLAYDVVLSVMGFGVGLYTFLVTDRFSMSNLQMTTMDTVMSFLAVALVIIAARRAVGNAMAILPILFSLYALFGRYIPGLLGHGGYTLKRFLMRMYMVDLFAGRLIPYLMIFRRLFMSELNFYLLQINDALFPIGAYSHSQGLET